MALLFRAHYIEALILSSVKVGSSGFCKSVHNEVDDQKLYAYRERKIQE